MTKKSVFFLPWPAFVFREPPDSLYRFFRLMMDDLAFMTFLTVIPASSMPITSCLRASVSPGAMMTVILAVVFEKGLKTLIGSF